MKKIKCPNCGCSHYMVNYSTSTAMYSPIVWKDGEIISEDNNYHTDVCSCLECGYDFDIIRHCGEVEVK